MSVFEVTEQRIDDSYLPLGIFETLDGAKGEIARLEAKGFSVSDNSEDEEHIIILERRFGWTENGIPVQEYWRTRVETEDGGDWVWKTIRSEAIDYREY